MALTPSTMVALGTRAPSFRLPDTSGELVSLPEPGSHAATLVVFMCNHCPYVKHVAEELARLGRELPGRDVAMFGINSNDAENYPADSPAAMVREVAARGYVFAYLFDEDQSVARAYRAACTPDFFLFDRDLKLVYRGELDDSRPGNHKPVTGVALRAAIDAVLEGRPVDPRQVPSMGCNIKWKG
ncbi:MAG TPA: thioredoxin family protein [Enhygromyxa sp.]|nr:thioredoxin family protein [Enhygromyxa sp.]